MKIIECTQGSPEWFAARRGIPTASNFDRILTPVQCKPSSAQHGYICELIAETYLGVTAPVVKSPAMQEGIDTEHQARLWYGLHHDVEVKQVGFCLSDNGRFGCSPDGLVGDDGLLELKCPTGKTHIEWLLKGRLPDDYKCQVHGQLIVTGRKWCDFVSYCPGLPALVVRVAPDEFTTLLHVTLDRFHDYYGVALAQIKALGG